MDRDHRSEADIRKLREIGVAVLPVTDLENLFLLPQVSREIALLDGYGDSELKNLLDSLRQAVFEIVKCDNQKKSAIMRYLRHNIDRNIKSFNWTRESDVEQLETIIQQDIKDLNIRRLAEEAEAKIDSAISRNDLECFLAVYEGKKELLALAAKHLRKQKLKDFELWLKRILRQRSADRLVNVIRNAIPDIPE